MKVKIIKSDYYDNPDRILIDVDISTHIDLFEDAYSQIFDYKKEFDWNTDGEDFNKASAELDRIIENNFATKFGHKAVEEFHDGETQKISVYHCTFWGDRNNPNDIKVLQELQGQADDKWTDNGRVELAIYDEEVYSGGTYFNDFVEKWGDIGVALAGAITVGVSFPEEFDSDPMYDNVNGLHILKNSKQIKSSVKKFELDEGERDALCEVIGYVIGALGEDEDIEKYKVAKDVLSEEEFKTLENLWTYVLDADYTYPKITDKLIDAKETSVLKKVYDILYEKDLLDWDAESAFEEICLD